MNRIILVGNGFDLAHGLPTRYEDFINWYWNEWLNTLRICHKQTESDKLCKFTLNSPHETWHGHLWCNLSILHKPQGKDFIEEINKYPHVYTIEKCHFLKKICKSINEKNWVDIENEYYRFLSSFLGDNPKYENPVILNNELDFIKSKLIEYLNYIQKTQIQNLPLNNNIRQNIFSPFMARDISVSAEEVWMNFIKKRIGFPQAWWEVLLGNYYGSNIFDRYHQIELFKCKYQKQIKDFGARSVPEEEFPEEFLLPDRIMVLNFNYTYTADAYIPKANCFKINHIHGELLKPESIIFGYGDELDESYKKLLKLNENEYLRNIKSIKYLESSNYRNMLSFIESAPYQVCIMGHSCGNSDRTLLNTLFEHKNCVSIKPFYYQKEEGEDNYLEIVQNICRNFTNMQLMRDNVVNKMFCSPLDS